MVAIISPDAPEGSIAALRKNILMEYGPTFWLAETGWVGGKLKSET